MTQQHTSMPSWRDRGDRPEAEVLIVPDLGRNRGNTFETYVLGQPHSRRPTLAEAKASVEDMFGDMNWTKVEGDQKSHFDKVWGQTKMFNDAPYYLVADLPDRVASRHGHDHRPDAADVLRGRSVAGAARGRGHHLGSLEDLTLTTSQVLSIASSVGSPGVRDRNGVESAVGQQQWFDDVVDRAAALAYSLANNHPFVDGNKRTAWVAARTLLVMAGYRVKPRRAEAVRIMVGVADGSVSREQFAQWLRGNSRTASLPGLTFSTMKPWEGPVQRVDNRGPNIRAEIDGQYAGHIYWDSDTGEVTDIWVAPSVQRRGVATALWNEAKSRDPKVHHSDEQTSDGKGWAAVTASIVDLDTWRPTSGMFAPGQPTLDPRIFLLPSEVLKPSVISAVLSALDDYWAPMFGPDWSQWANVFLTGSAASYWWDSDTDLDLMVGVDLDRLRLARPANVDVPDDEIYAHLNKTLHDMRPLTAAMVFEEGTTPFDVTYFVNPGSYDITAIHPYAAYDLEHGWIVHPPVLPANWGPSSISDSIWLQCEMTAREAQAVLALPEPERTLAGVKMFDWVHEGRRAAYSANGGGWLDGGNVVYQYLSLHPEHLLRRLYLLKHPTEATAADAIAKTALATPGGINMMGTGYWDTSGDEPQWVQPQDELVAAALSNWKGYRTTLWSWLYKIERSDSEPGSNGTAKIDRARAQALYDFFRAKAKPNPGTLYRGGDPEEWASWTTDRKVAEHWSHGGKVWTIQPGEVKALRISDHLDRWEKDPEGEWIVANPDGHSAIAKTASTGWIADAWSKAAHDPEGQWDYEVPVADLHPPTVQRLNGVYHPIERMVDDIAQHGVTRRISVKLPPAYAYDQTPTLSDGAHRLAAAEQAGLSTVPVTVFGPEAFAANDRASDVSTNEAIGGGWRTAAYGDSHGGTVYRGVRLDPGSEFWDAFEDYQDRSEVSQRRSSKAAKILLGQVTAPGHRHDSGMGVHWTERPQYAAGAAWAGGTGTRGEFPVVMEAVYTASDVEPEGSDAYSAGAVFMDSKTEAEVLIKPGARLSVTGLWVPVGPSNAQVISVDQCPEQKWNGEEWANILASPVTKTAKPQEASPDDGLGDFIYRGVAWSMPDEQRGYDLAKKAAKHTLSARDIIDALEPLGVWWGLPEQYGGMEQYQAHAETGSGDDLTAIGATKTAEEDAAAGERGGTVGENFFGCDLPVVFKAKRPKFYWPEGSNNAVPWDPAVMNPASGMDGNSYLPHDTRLTIVEVRYDPGDGWRTATGSGIATTAQKTAGLVAGTPEENQHLTERFHALGGDPSLRVETSNLYGDVTLRVKRGVSETVCALKWYDTGEISMVQTRGDDRRRGIAKTLLALGREVEPRLHHSTNLSQDGRGWSQAVGSKTAALSRTFTSTDEQTGGSKWPTKRTLRVHDGGKEVGSLTMLLSKTQRKGYVDNLQVHPDHRRQGHGSALMDEFVRRHPDTKIDHGQRTDDGKAWWKGYHGSMSVEAAEAWQMGHQPQSPDDGGAPLHNLCGGSQGQVFPDDVYTRPSLYSNGEPGFNETWRTILRARGNPSAQVTIYRALPAKFAKEPLQSGMWVSTGLDYAKQHATQNEEADDWPVMKYTVRADQVFNPGDSLEEYGYYGPNIHGTVVVNGGKNQKVADYKVQNPAGQVAFVLLDQADPDAALAQIVQSAQEIEPGPEQPQQTVARVYPQQRTTLGPWDRDLMHSITKDHGFTLHDHMGDGPTDGFMVSVAKGTEKSVPLSDIDPRVIADYMSVHQQELRDPSNFLGGWVYKGNVFLDISRHVDDEQQAEMLAKANHQIGIYDIANAQTILTK